MKKEDKIVFLGAQGVGKTALVYRLLKNSFTTSRQGKGGQEKVFDYVNTQTTIRQIVDYNGNDATLLTDAKAFVICYAIDDRRSFDAIDHYLDVILQTRIKSPNIVILGNKTDLLQRRAVSTNEALSLAKEINAPFYETSAKLPIIDVRQILMDVNNFIHTVKKRKELTDEFWSEDKTEKSLANTSPLLGFSRRSSRRMGSFTKRLSARFS